jgi:hypothetical protein
MGGAAMVTKSLAPWAEIVSGREQPMTADELFALPYDE